MSQTYDIPTLAILFDIDRLEQQYGSGNYLIQAWQVLWRTVGAHNLRDLSGSSLFECDTAGNDRGCCIAIQSSDESRLMHIRKALLDSQEYQAVSDTPMFLDNKQAREQPLMKAGMINAIGDIEGESTYCARPALEVVKQEYLKDEEKEKQEKSVAMGFVPAFIGALLVGLFVWWVTTELSLKITNEQRWATVLGIFIWGCIFILFRGIGWATTVGQRLNGFLLILFSLISGSAAVAILHYTGALLFRDTISLTGVAPEVLLGVVIGIVARVMLAVLFAMEEVIIEAEKENARSVIDEINISQQKTQVSGYEEQWPGANVIVMPGTHYANIKSASDTLKSHPNYDTRFRAALALGETFSEAAIPALAYGLLHDKYSHTRQVCAEYLWLIGGAEARSALETAATKDPEEETRSIAKQYLTTFKDAKNIALIEASSKGDLRRAEILLSKGADPNYRDADGNTALMKPIGWAPEIIDILLRYHANVDQTNNEGLTALHMVCKFGTVEEMNILINNGANVHIKSNKGEEPLVSLLPRYIEWVKERLRENPHKSPSAAENSTATKIQILLQAGAKIGDFKVDNVPFVEWAMKYAAPDFARQLEKLS